ncbi:MAG: bifunctional alpha,alpha-trehalose-phosphate synthase (UDP-forming)/trehalose-phosphatase [Spirochaetota bacterium]
MPKIIIASNRLPVSVSHIEDSYQISPSIGGLATGMKPIHEKEESIWLGWNGIVSDETDEAEMKRINSELVSTYKCISVDFTKNELDDYYYGFSNSTIWPLFHYFHDMAVYEDSYFRMYTKANEKFLYEIEKHVTGSETVWVHDYQLMLLPQMLKEKFPDLKIGFFLHIPLPSYEIFRLLPWRQEILEGMLGADLIGFHTFDYVRHFLSSVRRILGAESSTNYIFYRNRMHKADVFPMGIDYRRYSNALTQKSIKDETSDIIHTIQGKQMVLSVDRLDYTKGIPGRIRAFAHFLRENPSYRGKVTMIMIVAPSRTQVDTYADLLREIEELVSHANGELGELGWMPVWFFYRSFNFESLTALYGLADVMFVTPLRDGMNLIAKEYIATRKDKLGMLVISETAGAANELGEAIIVNPNNIAEIAGGLKRALEMPKVDQISRNEIMHRRLERYNVEFWASDFVEKINLLAEEQKRNVSHKLTGQKQSDILKQYQESANRLIFLDYDGTLMPFFEKHDQAKPDEYLYGLLESLASIKNNTVVLISGRDQDNLNNWFGALPVYLVASHGLWHRPSGGEWHMYETPSDEWKDIIRPVIEIHTDRTPGSLIEEKSFSIAWHYRRCDPDLVQVRLSELREILLDMTNSLNVGLLEGNKVLEVKDSAVNKGRAALHILNEIHPDFIFCAGDDWTDEDMFAALPHDACTVKVGSGTTKARFHIESVDIMREFLQHFISRCMMHRSSLRSVCPSRILRRRIVQ